MSRDLNPTAGSSLLPSRHPTGDFFICDIFDAIPKDDIATMEHPIFSLSTRPDRRVLEYEHGGARVKITPSLNGLATIHDKDILIYCISQLIAALNEGRQVSQYLTLKAHDLLVATNRETSGDGYRRLRQALERLAGTRITTNIVTGEIEATEGFGLIESWRILRKTRDGRMVSVGVKLSDWLYRAVLSKSVLTLSRDYFRLRKPLERRIYEIARKHCGRQGEWRIGLETLLKKSGSTSPRRVFRKMIRDLEAANHLPDYQMQLLENDVVLFTPRGRVIDAAAADLPPLPPEVIAQAREAAPGLDPYYLEQEWRRMWMQSGQPKLHAPHKAYLAFCRKRAAMKGGQG